MKHMHTLLMICIILVMLSGCSGGPTSEARGEAELQEKVDAESEGRIALIDFEKTDGVEREAFGTTAYFLQFTATIEFAADCKWHTTGLLLGKHDNFKTSPVKPKSTDDDDDDSFSWDDWHETTQNPGTTHQQGDQVTLSGEIVYEKTESGWPVRGLRFEVER